jgi:peptidoglycan L-alanyl-D-glutamate endopeptidase CwlK
MDQVSINRIKAAHPKIRKQLLETYNKINEKLLGKGVRLRLAYVTRTITEQNELFAQGRTKLFDASGKRLGIVTKAKGGESIHNYSLAWDIVLLLDKNGNGSFESASWDTILDFDKDGKSDWMEVVAEFKKEMSVVWGGDWKFKDAPHFECTFGHTWQSLKKLVDSGNVIKETINGITYTYPNI